MIICFCIRKFKWFIRLVGEMATDKEKALEMAINQIEGQFGKGAVMKLGDVKGSIMTEAIETGSLSLDEALGIGGIPRGRVTEIFGQESSGKTTLSLHIISESQKKGGTAAFIDAEHALDPVYAGNLGVLIDDLLISQPDHGEQALDITDYLVRSGAVDVIVIDSVAALVPKAELEGDMGDVHMGLQARLMSQALRKLGSSISKSKTAVVFVNQIREKVGVVFGNPEVTPGGRALKFYASVRIDMRRIDGIKQGNVIIGNRVRARVVKNKVAPPFRTAEFDIMFNQGISKEGDMVDLGTDMGIISKNGSFYSFGDIRLGQGRESAKEYLREHGDLALTITDQIRGTSSSDSKPESKNDSAKSEEEDD